MELQKISEVVSEELLTPFKIVEIENSRLSFEQGAFNFINIDETNEKITNAFVSDHSTLSTLENSHNHKINLVLDDAKLNNSLTTFMIDKNTNKIYFVESTSESISPSNKNESVFAVVLIELEELERSTKAKFIFTNLNTDKLTLKIPIKSALQKYEIINAQSEKQNINLETLGLKNLKITLNPIDINGYNDIYFANTFYWILLCDLLNLNFNADGSLYVGDVQSLEYFYFNRVKKVFENSKKIASNFTGMSSEEIKTFKSTIYNGTDVKEYANYEFTDFIKYRPIYEKNKLELLIAMCSSFIKSDFMVEEGLTTKHTYFYPFYFDYDASANKLYLKSNFYDFKIQNNKVILRNKKINSLDNLITLQEKRIPKTLNNVNVALNSNVINNEENDYRVLLFFKELISDNDYVNLSHLLYDNFRSSRNITFKVLAEQPLNFNFWRESHFNNSISYSKVYDYVREKHKGEWELDNSVRLNQYRVHRDNNFTRPVLIKTEVLTPNNSNKTVNVNKREINNFSDWDGWNLSSSIEAIEYWTLETKIIKKEYQASEQLSQKIQLLADKNFCLNSTDFLTYWNLINPNSQSENNEKINTPISSIYIKNFQIYHEIEKGTKISITGLMIAPILEATTKNEELVPIENINLKNQDLTNLIITFN